MTVSPWILGARPRTWPNAFAPVIAGTGAAFFIHGAHWGRALLALIVAWALIIGVNYSNDYSDGIRGTDEDRSGPLRLTGSGLVSPPAVKRAAFLAFGVAAVAGVALSLLSSPWLILVGALCILGAWFYTGGSHPYGYHGLGEVSVFLFFGLVAVLGTQFTQAGRVSVEGVLLAVGVGAISSAVNLANNLRDIPSDSAAGKTTLAVILGDARTRQVLIALGLLALLMSLLLAVLSTPWALLGALYLPIILSALRPVRQGATGTELIPLIGSIGKSLLLWSILSTIGLVCGVMI
ncbi:1,4-dihydroxy-2-naphthoate polyprenyltransferase [Corynebacterium uropygiale]|uniref:1,4-dihydroxy-2-naphthoate octaprenyltransferase n=1 Tax=Corynebacterium uropygiale TaxID=1775911 RepID=A0A9X1TZX5_9CORY|nr:1,4-dihydroxy-2-naphthoate polyprenyltransferase [Corynebacterium uropygiale]MCF4005838.1 1,4-dihydroxy-2-naphthoate polyprenyltransferase [Corynebacterium uropygiale]